MRKQGTQAERYRLVKKAKVSEDTIYTRTDLQKVDVNTLEKIPTKQKKATRLGGHKFTVVPVSETLGINSTPELESELARSARALWPQKRPANRRTSTYGGSQSERVCVLGFALVRSAEYSSTSAPFRAWRRFYWTYLEGWKVARP